ncbi:hypothetical protein Ais01nite_13180 [Asanoa ishikariensis]|uniref:Uncharacterized protein n=1 Tax=Asanoa ishikariensis TaxID=137265 RepID=A0A1H3SYX4_9ACTN|nr:hypothetical protein [Asanoa ishikariensis]GIF63283.1 hypothetical protein Ais01nite_13180 [Asanoa ishikariensis]SDZ42781.1 hypothetical protein SAMN05421684_4909 [Asanoa ishikariensis]
MIRKTSRWLGGALMAGVLTVAGLVAAPGAALAGYPVMVYSADPYEAGNGFAIYSNSGSGSVFRACDEGAADGRRTIGRIWWGSGLAKVTVHAANGSGTCSEPYYVTLVPGSRVYVEACERNGANGADQKCRTTWDIVA